MHVLVDRAYRDLAVTVSRSTLKYKNIWDNKRARSLQEINETELSSKHRVTTRHVSDQSCGLYAQKDLGLLEQHHKK